MGVAPFKLQMIFVFTSVHDVSFFHFTSLFFLLMMYLLSFFLCSTVLHCTVHNPSPLYGTIPTVIIRNHALAYFHVHECQLSHCPFDHLS